MPDSHTWISQTLTELRKLDRAAQRARLEAVLVTLSTADRSALRHEIEARRGRVEAERRAYETRGHGDPARKLAQKQTMIARYSWLLHIIEQHEAARPPQPDES